MTPAELADQVQDLHALLAAVRRLAPEHVSPELLEFLAGLPQSPVALSVLHSSLRLLAGPEPAKPQRREYEPEPFTKTWPPETTSRRSP